ncbi:TetR/AcrR family transcriptional regulator [Limosilactobacillus kribbianus]|uniref:TetR/AcrR family transcriptional regulator n=1 Tax=Limosilactobacillus kribbianus TaxID=2982695 RepID=UPI0022640A0F|nr:TetR/AcrR family transcriptional regulator [Limosilactobacillus kribbianus]
MAEYSLKASALITDALFELLKKNFFEKISITAITQKAGVARLSYYRNFTSKEDIVEKFFDHEFKNFMEELAKQDQSQVSLRSIMILSFSYWQKKHQQIRMLVRDGQIDLIYLSFQKNMQLILQRYQEQFSLTQRQAEFVEGGIMIVLLEWIQDGCQETPEEIAADVGRRFLFNI